jgi:ankyrin repeat protein
MDEDVPVEDPWGATTAAAATYTSPAISSVPLPRSLDDAVTSQQTLSKPRFAEVAEDPLVRAILDDSSLSQEQKSEQLQELFSRAASNGDIQCVRSIIHGVAREHVDIDEEDEDGMTPLIHAACFGHVDVVKNCKVS